MAYVSPDTDRFYLSRETLIQLHIISKNFPEVGSAQEVSGTVHEMEPCGCPTRTLPPTRPQSLSFECTTENNPKMRDWLVNRYATSTFNKCPHQQLPGMTGPAIRFHVDPKAEPVAVHTPSTVPLHWQEVVEKQINDDIALGVLERVPIGELSLWCHQMVLVKKADGTPRRTVNLSPLNRHCLRETYHVEPHSNRQNQSPLVRGSPLPMHGTDTTPSQSMRKTVISLPSSHHGVATSTRSHLRAF